MKPYYQEPNVAVHCGHALEVLKEMPAESVDMVMTSPPYWGLRTYKTEPQIWGDNHCEHEWQETAPRRNRKASDIKDLNSKEATNAGNLGIELPTTNTCLKCNAWRGELGLEPTIELYISHLLQIFNEVKRVLKKTGTLFVNIDDSYASGKGTCFNPGGGKGSFSGHGDRKDAGAYPLDRGNVAMLKAEGLLPKSLCLIPQRFAIAMVEQGWILRNDICWNKPNPMPESIKDRFTGSWEHLFFFVKSKKYWFEQQFEEQHPDGRKQTMHRGCPKYSDGEVNQAYAIPHERWGNPLGRNKRDVWEITTQPYPEAHFATFPEKLCEIPVLAGCPSAICKKCGKVREKVLEHMGYIATGHGNNASPKNIEAGREGSMSDKSAILTRQYKKYEVIGYTDCGCNAGFEPGVVLDHFCGSGTVLAVAKKLGRRGIGIDLSSKYCGLTVKRLQGIPIPMELNC